MTQTFAVDADGVHEQIITTVATLEGTDPIELPPLFDAVDPDALEALFAPTGTGTDRVGTVEFPYVGYTVALEYDGEIVVTVE